MNHDETVQIDEILAKYLQKQEAGEPVEREALIAAHPEYADEIQEFLGDLEQLHGIAAPADVEKPGTQIGPYKIREQIGQGGFGVVYLAEQIEPVRRRVALKVIKPGMDSEEVIGRFEAERQALALMDHPNIATVLDAGATDSGRPYFVMELVKGVPITEYCDQCSLTTRDRLELFRTVCQAVQHAHQKGIIHRDVKPSNVLVAMQDGQPVPKVIDFGIAKAINQRLTEQSVRTAFAQMIGTPLYMSPEQAEMSALDVDTRSDIYSLGVLLYELLTGTTPISKDRLQTANYDELRRMIREEEPPRPSDRLSTLGEGVSTVAEHRRTEPRKLRQTYRGDLDWIVMKALEKDRTRRYETANGLAEDVRRYLADEPVEACPPSRAYRFRKFVRRNKVALSTGVVIALLLIVGTVVSTWQAIRATTAEDSALAALGEKDRALTAEAAANRQARKRLGQIEKANAILASVFEDLNPNWIRTDPRPLRAILVEKLDKAAEHLNGEAIGDPLVVADMQATLSESLLGLGEAGKAVGLLEKSRDTRLARLGPDDPRTLSVMHGLGEAYRAAGRLKPAVTVLEETLRRRKAVLGTRDRQTVHTMNSLATACFSVGKLKLAIPLFEETLKRRREILGPRDLETLTTANDLAVAYQKAGMLERALEFATVALTQMNARLPDHPNTLTAVGNLATACRSIGKWKRAMALYKEEMKRARMKLGPNHPVTLTAMSNLATAYHDAKNYEQAVALYEDVLNLTRAKFGPDHPDTLSSMHNLASCYDDAGKPKLALAMLQQALKRQEKILGRDHPHTLSTMERLGLHYYVAGRLDRALPLYEKTLERETEILGVDHPATLTTMGNLAAAYLAVGKRELSLSLYEKVVKHWTETLGPDHPSTLRAMDNLGSACRDAGKLELALPLLEQTLKLSKKKLGPNHPDTAVTMSNLAIAYRTAKRETQALPLLQNALKILEDTLGEEHPTTNVARQNVALLYVDTGKPESAIPLYETAFKFISKSRGPEHPDTLLVMTNLASAYLTAGKRESALQLAENTLKLARKLNPEYPRTRTILNDLAGTYVNAGKPERALPILKDSLRRAEAKPGPRHSQAIAAMSNLAETYMDLGRLEAALPLFEQACKLQIKHFGPSHRQTPERIGRLKRAYRAAGKPETALPMLLVAAMTDRDPDAALTYTAKNNLAGAWMRAKRYDKSIALLKEVVRWNSSQFGRSDPRTLASLGNLGVTCNKGGRFTEAVPLLEEVHRAAKVHPRFREVSADLLEAYAGAGKTEQAAALSGRVVALGRRLMPIGSPRLAGFLDRVGSTLLKSKAFTAAERPLRECLAIRRRTRPDSWVTFHTQSMLGEALLGQKKFREAEPLLREGYAGMLQREKRMPPAWKVVRLSEAAQRLVTLFKSRGRQWDAERAARWRAELAAVKARYLRPPVVALRPDRAAEYYHLALELIRQRKYRDAVRNLRVVLRIQPENFAARYTLGRIFEAMRDSITAVEEYQVLVRTASDHYGAHFRLGILFANQGKLDQAIASYRRAVEIDPESVDAHRNLARTLVQKSGTRGFRWQDAAAAYAALYQLFPDDGSSINDESFEYACTLLLTGDRKRFERVCAEMRQRAGDSPNATMHCVLGRIHGLTSKSGAEPQQLVGWGKKAVAGDDNAWFLHTLSLAHYRAGQFRDAIRRAEESNTRPWRGARKALNSLVVAMARHRLGQKAEARRTFLAAEMALNDSRNTLAAPDILEFNVLRREARQLLGLKAVDETVPKPVPAIASQPNRRARGQ